MPSLRPAHLALAALGFAASSGLAQQQGTQLESGARVRLSSPTLQSDQRIVRIVSVVRDTVEFRAERDPVAHRIALIDISMVEASIGEQRRTGRGALIGFVSGVLIGGIAGYASQKDFKEECEEALGFFCVAPASAGESAAIGGLVGGVAGLAVGTTIGWLSKSEKWQRISFDARPAVVPSSGGVLVTVSRPFD